MTYKTSVNRDIDITVTYRYYKGCRGKRDSLCGVHGAGPPLEPDEPPSVEIIRAVDRDGRPVDLSDAEISPNSMFGLKSSADG